MRMNRRNVLVGLGTIVAGGGAALGTGAFSSVSADREVDINVQGDSAGLLGLEITNDTLGGENEDDTIIFDLDDLNVDATTEFTGAFEISNNGSSPFSVEIKDADSDDDLIVTNADNTNTGMNFVDEGDELSEIEDTETVTLDVVFDLVGETDASDDGGADNAIPDEITITATSADEP
ncbi:hypothetical protein [Natronorubrum sp. DTA28]|uniref:hypothetical protein n=1 Tax=Natronorubrum sp. DTA28 TaxID=3447019 RepID=UPI003F8314CD